MARLDRRSLASLLIGVIAAFAGLWSAAFLRQDRCLDAGGSWTAGVNVCALPPGAAPETVTQTAAAYGLGAVVAIVVSFILWRAFAFAAGARPTPPNG